MTTYFSTRKRRALQVLWSKLDVHLLPYAEKGMVLAVSGGPDSRALMESVASWPKRSDLKIVVASIDHGQRSESQEEVNFIARRAKRLGFSAESLSLLSLYLPMGEQELRFARYRSLADVARKHDCRVICAAHHGDDNAEGLMMAMMGVGGGEMGSGMSEMAVLGDLLLVRPFLSLSKRELLLPLTLGGHTDFVVDRLDERRMGQRAFVRHEILPDLYKNAPLMRKRLPKFSTYLRTQREALERRSEPLIRWQENSAHIDISSANEPSLIVRALWQILKKWGNGKDLRQSQSTIDRILDDIGKTDIGSAKAPPWLDPVSNGFNLEGLGVKQYHFPGVVVLRGPNDIVAKRV